MGLYKLCEHKGRARDRCAHGWWARYRHVRASLEKWSNDEIKTKTKAEEVFDDLRKAVRAGKFDKRGAEPKQNATPLTFRQFAEVYKGAARLRQGPCDQRNDRLPTPPDREPFRRPSPNGHQDRRRRGLHR